MLVAMPLPSALAGVSADYQNRMNTLDSITLAKEPGGADELRPTEKSAYSACQRERVGDRVSIFRIAESPNWYMNFNLDGKQFRRSLKTRSHKQAVLLAKKKNAELTLDLADPHSKPAVKIGDANNLYLRSLELRDVSAGAISNYRRDLRQFAAYAQSRGIMRLDRVDEELLEDFQLRLKTQGMNGIVPQRKKGRRLGKNKPKTLRNKLKSVRQLIKWAIRRRLLRTDPAGGYRLPPEPTGKAFCWSPEEHQTLRSCAEQPWLDIFDFLALTGLRSDELCWLLKDDICLDGRPYVSVRSKLCPQTGQPWKPKHGRERIVPLCPQAERIARDALKSSRGLWLFWSLYASGKQPGHFRRDAIWRALQKVKQKAGIARGTVHTFRHLFCSFMANNQVPPFKVMTIMGHGSMDIVLMYYHVNDQELLRSLEGVAFNQMLSNQNVPEQK
jgi:site-specific recombinase XerD